MSIVLVRHGRPDATAEDRRRISGAEIGQWCRRYDELGIAATPHPPAPLRKLAESAYIVTSDRRRAMESARLLAGAREIRIDPDLREAGLPAAIKVGARLHPGAWVVTARIAWLLGYGDSEETVTAARERAARVAAHLMTVALVQPSVLVVGHGWFNRLIALELQRQGWQGPSLLRAGYWSSATYSPVDP